MPPAQSLSTSRILRIGNLCPGMPSSSQKELMPCRFEDHPTVPVTSVHSLVAIARNGGSRSIGTPGRNQLEQVVAITRCAQSLQCRPLALIPVVRLIQVVLESAEVQMSP